MKKWILLLALAFLSAVLASGCKTGVNVIEPARPAASADVILDKRIILDRALARNLEVEYLNQAFTGDLRTVQSTVRNTTGRAIQFQYRYDWVDVDGMHISSPASTWVIRTLEPGETTSLAATAPTPRAADFRFQIKAHQPR
jgi:uncharacterized protein YcfL